MDVKDVKQVKATSDQQVQKANSGLQRSINTLTSPAVSAKLAEPVSVQVNSRPEKSEQAALRSKANQAIDVVNLAEDAASEIEKLVKSIDGISSQAVNADSDNKRQILEREANELVDEIKKKAQVETSDGFKPLAGDKIKLEVEEKLGRTLEIILPDDASRAFDIGKVNFSPKDNIINTIANIKKARERIEQLRNSVDSARQTVTSTVSELEVAIQNSEAAETTIRDVDQALQVASETSQVITRNPEAAINSVGDLQGKALNLVRE
ncbi:MAG: hypothetical protein D6719_13245 [Candidatus Dadabacteria bacterium]|nr:MAG: hypothetical protein D6719_13245 [Candidatus Dadabacteria bacterium]